MAWVIFVDEPLFQLGRSCLEQQCMDHYLDVKTAASGRCPYFYLSFARKTLLWTWRMVSSHLNIIHIRRFVAWKPLVILKIGGGIPDMPFQNIKPPLTVFCHAGYGYVPYVRIGEVDFQYLPGLNS
jgi:hypothetical protein